MQASCQNRINNKAFRRVSHRYVYLPLKKKERKGKGKKLNNSEK